MSRLEPTRVRRARRHRQPRHRRRVRRPDRPGGVRRVEGWHRRPDPARRPRPGGRRDPAEHRRARPDRHPDLRLRARTPEGFKAKLGESVLFPRAARPARRARLDGARVPHQLLHERRDGPGRRRHPDAAEVAVGLRRAGLRRLVRRFGGRVPSQPDTHPPQSRSDADPGGGRVVHRPQGDLGRRAESPAMSTSQRPDASQSGVTGAAAARRPWPARRRSRASSRTTRRGRSRPRPRRGRRPRRGTAAARGPAAAPAPSAGAIPPAAALAALRATTASRPTKPPGLSSAKREPEPGLQRAVGVVDVVAEVAVGLLHPQRGQRLEPDRPQVVRRSGGAASRRTPRAPTPPARRARSPARRGR